MGLLATSGVPATDDDPAKLDAVISQRGTLSTVGDSGLRFLHLECILDNTVETENLVPVVNSHWRHTTGQPDILRRTFGYYH